ncbi:MAG: PEP-CTERM sorting domain-containing protein [Phycisphaerae bacterium]
MKIFISLLLVVALTAASASAELFSEDFNTEADWFPGTEDPVDPGLSGYWDVERVSVPTNPDSAGTGWYYGGKLGDNGHNTPDGSWSLYNNANGSGGNYSNARHLLWTEDVSIAQADVTAYEFDYKSRRNNLTDIHIAVMVGEQFYISSDHVTDTRGDRDLPYLHAVFDAEGLAWVPITLERLDVNESGQNANAYGPQSFELQNNPENLAPLFGVLPSDLPEGDIEAVGFFVASGSHIDCEYVENSRATVYLDNLVVVPEPATMALLGFGALGVLIRRRRK